MFRLFPFVVFVVLYVDMFVYAGPHLVRRQRGLLEGARHARPGDAVLLFNCLFTVWFYGFYHVVFVMIYVFVSYEEFTRLARD